MTALDAEFGYPAWGFRMSSYAFAGASRVVCAYTTDGLSHLATLDVTTKKLTPIDVPYNTIGSVRASAGKVCFVGASATTPPAVVMLDLDTGEFTELKRASDRRIDPGYISVGEPFDFPTADGLTAHAFLYPPTNRDFTAPADEKPPLVVMVHGGPTGATTASLKMKVQYYTSRGIAVCDVNYGGSAGYGRAYRERLKGKWGIVDVDDACAAATVLARRGLVDAKRLAITGGSAGGYTVLSCLAFRDVFAAGASHYGISDCEALARDTHKFESRYLDGLIAPYPAGREVYHERSALYHLDGFNCPVAFFQGLEDEIVPPNQARMLADALRKKGIAVAHVEFAGEQHGFRQAPNIIRALEGELYFFSRVFGFDLADAVEPIEIENLRERG
ncbi:MAG TPA: prolyl oligopeptidase family serine peptidase [Planctomycetota bacterium]|nr:prolyl oligopeptidase family serine peptidase [Planctomycetota bacterium]